MGDFVPPFLDGVAHGDVAVAVDLPDGGFPDKNFVRARVLIYSEYIEYFIFFYI